MNAVAISDRISYMEASDHPLSADIGIVKADNGIWLYDVGNGGRNVAGLTGRYHVVLSHFHADHTGNLGRVEAQSLYVSGETCRHVRRGTVIRADAYIGDMHIFPLPSCHAKGCLGLEVGGAFAFVGDALYGKARDGSYVYNAQLLQQEIEVLGALRAPCFLVSHVKGLARSKEDVLEELKTIYGKKEKGTPDIIIRTPPG